jgi:spore germination protein KA
MLVAFELLQEAGLRLPNPVGETVSIIGAIIVGQSAVEAKIVSPVVVIVVAIAGITGYTVPNQDMSMALRICRFIMVLSAIFGGMYGVILASVLLIYHLCSLESMGTPYMAPFAGAEGKFVGRALMQKPLSGSGAGDPTIGGMK